MPECATRGVRQTTTRLLALRRSRADLGSVAAIATTVLVVCTLVSGLVGALPELQRRALGAALDALPAEERVVAVTASHVPDLAATQHEAVGEAVAPVLAVAGGRLVRTTTTVAHPAVDGGGAWAFGSVDGGPGQPVVETPQGRLPRRAVATSSTVEVAVPVGSDVSPGSEWALRSPLDDRTVNVRVVGTWRPAERTTALVPRRGAGLLLVADDDLDRLAGSGTTVRWLATTDPRALRPTDLGPLGAAAGRLDRAVAEAAVRTGRGLRLHNPLPEAISRLEDRLSTQRALLLAPVLMLALAGAAAATLAAAVLGRRRRSDEELIRARGAARLAQVAPSTWEALAVCLAASLVGLVLGRLVPRALGVHDRLSGSTLLATVGAGVLCWFTLSLPSWVRAVGPDRGEVAAPETVQRRRLTRLVAASVVTVAAGVLGLISLERLQSRASNGAVDLMGVLAPSLLLTATATLAVGSLLPLLFRLATGVLRTRGPVLHVASRTVARQLGEALPLALVTALVAGTFAFAVVQDRSRDATLAARARHEVGAAVRVVAPPDALRAGVRAEREQLEGLPGVTSAGGVHRELRFVDDVAADLVVADLREPALRSMIGGSGVSTVLAGTDEGAVGAAVSIGLVEATGLVPGSRFELPVDGVPTVFEVVTTVHDVPTVEPGREAVLVDRAAVPHPVGVDEWWLDVEPGAAPAVARSLRDRPQLADSVLTRGLARNRLMEEPDTGGAALPRVLSAVAVGTAALGLVALVSVALLRRAERRRWSEFLRALGASRREVGLTSVAEHALVTAGGGLFGLAVGVGTAVLAVSASPVRGVGVPVVPTSIDVAWAWLATALAALVVVPLVALRLVPAPREVGR